MELEFFDKMSDRDLFLFKKCIRRLLDVTFIVGSRDEKLYEFITSGSMLFDMNSYLRRIGFQVVVDERLRVAMLAQGEEGEDEVEGLKRDNLLRFNKIQVQLLLVLWELYLNRMGYREPVYVTRGDVMDQASLYKFDLKPADIKKAYVLFKRYQLIHFDDAEVTEDTPIELLPSLQFCMDLGQIRSIIAEYVPNAGEITEGNNNLEIDVETDDEEDDSFDDQENN